MVHLDAEQEHLARGRQNRWTYLRGYVTIPREASRKRVTDVFRKWWNSARR